MSNIIKFNDGSEITVNDFSFSRIKETHYWNNKLLNPEYAERKDYEIRDMGKIICTLDISEFI